MNETKRARLFIGAALSTLLAAGCAVQPADDFASSDIESAEGQLQVCSAAVNLSLSNTTMEDLTRVFGDQANWGVKSISPTTPLKVKAGHTYEITTDVINKATTGHVDYPGIVLNSSCTSVKTELTYPQAFALLAGQTMNMSAQATFAPTLKPGTKGRLYLAPTANYGQCKGSTTLTFNYEVVAGP